MKLMWKVQHFYLGSWFQYIYSLHPETRTVLVHIWFIFAKSIICERWVLFFIWWFSHYHQFQVLLEKLSIECQNFPPITLFYLYLRRIQGLGIQRLEMNLKNNFLVNVLFWLMIFKYIVIKRHMNQCIDF